MTDHSILHSPTPRGPVVPDDSPDILNVWRRRAEQASQYYHSIGLSNGNLRREQLSLKSDRKRWSGSPDRTLDAAQSVYSSSARSQPTTPVTQSFNKHSTHWRKPSLPNAEFASGGTPELTAVKFKTLPRNRITPMKTQESRTPRLSSNDSCMSVYRQPMSQPTPTDDASHQDALISEASKAQSSQSSLQYKPMYRGPYSTLPRNFDLNQNKAPTLVKSSTVDQRDAEKIAGKDAATPLTRADSHLYTRQATSSSRASERKPSAEYEITYTLPHTKPRKSDQQNKEADKASSVTGSDKGSRVQRQRSNSDTQEGQGNDARLRSKLSNSLDQIDDTVSFGSGSSLNETNDEEPVSSEIFHGYKKSKLGTRPNLSPSVRSHKKSQSDDNPSVSAGSSPKMPRRHHTKQKSKSDVADHRTLINRLHSLQNDSDVYGIIAETAVTTELAKKHRHNFAHYDWQSMLFSFCDVTDAMKTLKTKNAPTGASRAAALAAASSESLASKSSSNGGSQEDVSIYLGEDEGLELNRFNDLVASCPYFRNDIGGEKDRVICVAASSSLSVQVGNGVDASTKHAESVLTNHTYLSIVEHNTSSKLLPPHTPPSGSVSFGIENVDDGATYYRTHFFDKDHQNFFGIDEKYGPILISLRREKVEDRTNYGNVLIQYRIIVRTCELCTLRGSLMEEVMSSSKHTPSKGYPAKDVIEYVCPEINVSCLKVAQLSPKVHEQLMKVDEHNLQRSYKIGVLYCRAGQTTEEEIYNNEHGSPAFQQFLNLLGKTITLNGFKDYRGGLDVKTDSTGTESVFTTFNGNEIMFHVSTLLPFTPNNKQQLLRKRHIGNDITTIVFQEPGSEPFNPKHFHSQFQHIFVVVRVHNPCTDNTCYSVAVTRSRNIPRFGPPIPEDSMIKISSTFREFLLTKVINGENTAHKAGKFKALAVNTREQYLRDLAVNSNSANGLEEATSFGSRFKESLINRRAKDSKDKQKLKPMTPALNSAGAITWDVTVDDYSRAESVHCILGMSDCVLSIIEIEAKQLIFSIPCQAVLGWTVPPPSQENMKCYKRDLHIYYGRGERILIHTDDVDAREEIILRLERFTKGSETVYRQLHRNSRGELGFHVNYEGVVMDVEPGGCAAVDGLKQSSRLVEICKVAVATMSHEEIVDFLRTSDRVTVVFIPPNDDGTPRKCSMELYHLSPVLDSRKANLFTTVTPPSTVSHQHSKSEPVTNNTAKSQAEARRVSQDLIDSQCKDDRQESDDELLHSAAIEEMFSTFHYISPNAPVNTNNNSSYPNPLPRSSPNPPTSSRRQTSYNMTGYTSSPYNLNSNNNNETITVPEYSPKSRCKKPRKEFMSKAGTWNSRISTKESEQDLSIDIIPSTEVSRLLRVYTANIGSSVKASKFNQSETTTAMTSSHQQSRSEPYIMDHDNWRRQPIITSQSTSEMTKKPSVEAKPCKSNQKNKRKDTSTPTASSKLKTRDRSRHTATHTSSQSKSNDLQSSLIRLLTFESPTKLSDSTTQKPPLRWVKPCASPLRHIPQSPRKNPSFFRTLSDESLCGARTDEVVLAREDAYEPAYGRYGLYSHTAMGSLDSLSPCVGKYDPYAGGSPNLIPSPVNRQASFPLPDCVDWDRLLDAAKAAEAFEASNVKSASMGRLSEAKHVTRDVSHCSPKRNQNVKRTMSVEKFDENDSRGILFKLERPDSLKHPHPISSTPIILRGGSDQRLLRIEKEMVVLQEKLKQAQDSKKKLEKERSSLRQDKSRLLRQMRVNNPALVNEYRAARKSTKS